MKEIVVRAYAVFRWDHERERGCLRDLAETCDTIEEARLLTSGFPHWQIVDMQTWQLAEASAGAAYDAAPASPRPLWRVEAVSADGRVLETATVDHPDPRVAATIVRVPFGGTVRVFELPLWAEADVALARAIVLGIPRTVVASDREVRLSFQPGLADPFVGALERPGALDELTAKRTLADLLWWAVERLEPREPVLTIEADDLDGRPPS